MFKLTLPLLLLFCAACDHTAPTALLPTRGRGADLGVHIAPPFAPPAVRGDGSTEGDGGTPSPPAGPARWTLTGEVTQVTPCAGGGSAARAYVALTATCGDWSALLHKQVVPLTVAKPRYAFQVPDGTYHLIAFADCNGAATAKAPSPLPGDVQYVTTNPDDKPCSTYKLQGQGLFDLPLKLEAPVR